MTIPSTFAILIFALVPLAIKLTPESPITICWFRLFIASLLFYIFKRKEISFKIYLSKKAINLYLIGILFFFHWLTYSYAIKIAGPSLTVLGMSTYGIQLIIYGSIFLSYKLKFRNYLALCIAIIGIVLVMPLKNGTGIGIANTKGMILALASASFYAMLPIVHQRSHQFNHSQRIFSQFFLACLLFSLLFPWIDLPSSKASLLGIAFLGIFGTFIAHSLWAYVTSHLNTNHSGIIYYLITPNAILLSHFILKENLTAKQLIGGGFIIAAAATNLYHRSTTNK